MFTHHHSLNSHFDARGGFSTSPNPPSHRNARRRVCSPTTTLSTCVSMRGGDFRPPPTLPHIETRDGGLFTHHHPLDSHFDARGGDFRPPPHRNARRGFVHPPPPPRLTFRHKGGGFDLPDPPSHRNVRWHSPPPLRLAFQHDGWCFIMCHRLALLTLTLILEVEGRCFARQYESPLS